MALGSTFTLHSHFGSHTGLKLLHIYRAKSLIYLPGAGLEPARTLPGPRDFKSRVSTNSTIRAQRNSIAYVALRFNRVACSTCVANLKASFTSSGCRFV